MTTRNTHEWTVAEVRDAAITNEHPIPLRVRDMLNAYADDLDRRAEGVTEDVCRQVLAKLPLYAASTPIEMVRAALLAVWPVAAELVAQSGVAGEVFGPKDLSTQVALSKPLPPGTKLYTAQNPYAVPDEVRKALSTLATVANRVPAPFITCAIKTIDTWLAAASQSGEPKS